VFEILDTTMAIKDTLEKDLIAALKSKDSVATGALRLLINAIKNEELKGKGEVDDNAVIGVLSTQAKQRRESIEAFENAGRTDLAEKEKRELEIIQNYLPKQLSEDELEKLVDEAIAEAGASSPKDMGKVMKLLTPKTKGRADGKMVSELVKKKLS
jgi:uncharacterized protein YqeY